MSQYVHRSGWSYEQYLQTKSFVDDARWDINQNALKVGGSIDALAESRARIENTVLTGTGVMQETVLSSLDDAGERIEDVVTNTSSATQDVIRSEMSSTRNSMQHGLSRLEGTVSSGFVRLHFDLDKIHSSTQEMSARFDYGLSQLNTKLGAINDSLEELKRLAKNPEQTWSYEQYEIARDAFARGLFEEALTYASRAVDGHQSHTGYLLDHRVHYFLGVVRLGDYRNTSSDVLNFPMAEKAFLSAARYARTNYPSDAARALCCAGFAAYAQGKSSDAEKFTEQAVALNGQLPEARYQLSKVLFHKGEPKKGLPHLAHAIAMDRMYAVKCFGDQDFLVHEGDVIDCISNLAAQHRSRLHSTVVALRPRVRTLVPAANALVGELDALWSMMDAEAIAGKPKLNTSLMMINRLHAELESTLDPSNVARERPYIDTLMLAQRVDESQSLFTESITTIAAHVDSMTAGRGWKWPAKDNWDRCMNTLAMT
jgi:tetratricopeptide (TPR) repeat protein